MSILTLISDTLVSPAAAGNIEYNGQFYGTDSNAARAQLQRITQTTAWTYSSAVSSVDFTGIPAWAKKITVMFSGVSTSSTSNWLIQLGDSGGFENTGYLSVGTFLGATTGGTSYTTGFGLPIANASHVAQGLIILSNLTGNVWTANGSLAGSGTAAGFTYSTAGAKTLSDTLTQVRITTTGADNFDAGSINILYEG